MGEIDFYRELYVWLSRRADVIEARFDDEMIVLRPQQQTYDSGRIAPPSVRVAISRAEFEAAWGELRDAGVKLHLGTASTLPEVAAFALLDVHLDEGVNSMQEPGPNGFAYINASFRPV